MQVIGRREVASGSGVNHPPGTKFLVPAQQIRPGHSFRGSGQFLLFPEAGGEAFWSPASKFLDLSLYLHLQPEDDFYAIGMYDEFMSGLPFFIACAQTMEIGSTPHRFCCEGELWYYIRERGLVMNNIMRMHFEHGKH